MKLNNKGMSIIEIVVTFALIMVMVLQMLTIVMNYREKASRNLKELDLETFKDTLTRDIQKDILAKGVEEINTDGECKFNTNLNQCINIVFSDGSQKAFGTSKINVNDVKSIENKYLYYDGLKYKLSDNLPEEIPSGRNVLDFQSIIVKDNSILSTDSIVLDNGSTVSIYSIDVYISHIDFEQDFGIHIVATSSIKEEEIEEEENSNAKLLKNEILKANPVIKSIPTLSTTSKASGDESGLYKSTATNFNGVEGKPTYYFRGNVTNNYIKFAGYTWRIVRINEDGTIRIVFQDPGSYVDLKDYYYNVGYTLPGNMYYSNSYVKSKLKKWYENYIQKDRLGLGFNYYLYVATGDYFCEQAKGYTSSSYEPNFKCSNDSNGYGLFNSNIGLLSYDEVVHAGGYYGTSNSNYYLYTNAYNWWTMSPSSYNGSTAFVHYVSNLGTVSGIRSDTTARVRPVVNLVSDVYVTGSGTEKDPYQVNYNKSN